MEKNEQYPKKLSLQEQLEKGIQEEVAKYFASDAYFHYLLYTDISQNTDTSNKTLQKKVMIKFMTDAGDYLDKFLNALNEYDSDRGDNRKQYILSCKYKYLMCVLEKIKTDAPSVKTGYTSPNFYFAVIYIEELKKLRAVLVFSKYAPSKQTDSFIENILKK